jgi:hypothetical protein
MIIKENLPHPKLTLVFHDNDMSIKFRKFLTSPHPHTPVSFACETQLNVLSFALLHLFSSSSSFTSPTHMPHMRKLSLAHKHTHLEASGAEGAKVLFILCAFEVVFVSGKIEA